MSYSNRLMLSCLLMLSFCRVYAGAEGRYGDQSLNVPGVTCLDEVGVDDTVWFESSNGSFKVELFYAEDGKTFVDVTSQRTGLVHKKIEYNRIFAEKWADAKSLKHELFNHNGRMYVIVAYRHFDEKVFALPYLYNGTGKFFWAYFDQSKGEVFGLGDFLISYGNELDFSEPKA